MHPWCGTPQGDEGFGQPILCPTCEHFHHTTVSVSASPIPAAFISEVMDISDDDSDEADLSPSQHSESNHRACQMVSTLQQRRLVVKWMQENQQECRFLSASTVDTFPQIFTAELRQTNIKKARRWWEDRETLLHLPRGSLSVSKVKARGRVTMRVKAMNGRGRKQRRWVQWLYPKLLSEFSRLRKLGLQFDSPLLREVAVQVLKDSKKDYTSASCDEKGTLLIDKITPRWIQSFMEKHRIVLRAQTGKKQVSEEK
ncbi:TPA: hypothetical protein N0F65_005734, partial [Lagenidium giganteum]